MKFVDEYRDAPAAVAALRAAIAQRVTRPWTLMEICGGQTHSILRFGLDRLLPSAVQLVHGPGCPVCVTPISFLDTAVALAAVPRVSVCSFGDMLRVPGTDSDLLTARSRGGDVRIVYSPLDAVKFAAAHPEREVVFLAVGFETTAPANALAVLQARALGLRNFSLLTAQMLVPPAIAAILSAPDNHVQGFLTAGHVCTVAGLAEYERLAAQFRVPMVACGFEPVDILHATLRLIEQLERGEAGVENAYGRAVRPGGNPRAQQLIREVFAVVDQEWRGLGPIPQSGLALRPTFREFDATHRFAPHAPSVTPARDCQAGEILRGAKKPTECPAFGTRCTPDHPLGAPMVSSEGACAAYYRYRPVLRS